MFYLALVLHWIRRSITIRFSQVEERRRGHNPRRLFTSLPSFCTSRIYRQGNSSRSSVCGLHIWASSLLQPCSVDSLTPSARNLLRRGRPVLPRDTFNSHLPRFAGQHSAPEVGKVNLLFVPSGSHRSSHSNHVSTPIRQRRIRVFLVPRKCSQP